MRTKAPIPGLGLLGIQYDVTQYYTDSRSVFPINPILSFNHSGYDPDNDPNAKRASLYGKDCYFPKGLSVVPIMRSTPIFIDQTVQTHFEAKSSYSNATLEAKFKPSSSADKVAAGVGLRVNSDDFKTMKLWQAPLYHVAESATVVVEAASALV